MSSSPPTALFWNQRKGQTCCYQGIIPVYDTIAVKTVRTQFLNVFPQGILYLERNAQELHTFFSSNNIIFWYNGEILCNVCANVTKSKRNYIFTTQIIACISRVLIRIPLLHFSSGLSYRYQFDVASHLKFCTFNSIKFRWVHKEFSSKLNEEWTTCPHAWDHRYSH